MRIACVLWILFIGLVKSFDDDINTSWNRFDRAAGKTPPTPKGPPGKAPPTGKPKNSSAPTGPPLPSIVSRHMKLAPVLNALYIDVELSNGKIDSADVVAGLWNLKDKTVLDKLVSLDTKQLSTVLNTLDEKIKTVPDSKIVDVERIKGAFDTIKGVTANSREKLRAAMEGNAVPAFLVDTNFGAFSKLSDDLGDKFVTLFDKIVSDTNYQKGAIADLTPIWTGLETFSDIAEIVEKIQKSSEKPLDAFREGVTLATGIYSNVEQYKEASESLSNAKTIISSIQSHINTIDEIKGKEIAKSLNEILADVHQPNVNPLSLNVAFRHNETLPNVVKYLSTNWVRDVIGARYTDMVRPLFQRFENFSSKYSAIEGFSRSLVNELLFSQASMVYDLVKEVENFKTVSGVNEIIEPLIPCLTLPANSEPIKADEWEKISANSKTFLTQLDTIQTALNPLKEFLDKMKTHLTTFGEIKDQATFDAWMSGPSVQEVKDLLSDENKGHLTELKQDAAFTNAAARLDSTKTNLKKAQKWLAEFKLASSDCDELFSFDVDSLSQINGAPQAISQMKTQKPVEKLQTFLKVISDIKSGLKAFSENSSSKNSISESSKNLKKLKITNPANLLTVAHAIRSLEKINKINTLDKDLATVIQQGDIVLAAISNISDTQKKEMLEKIWKDFPVIKQDMIRLKKKTLEAMKVIKPQDPEKNLEDVGKIYESIRKFSFNERIDLRPLRRSLELFDAPGFPEMQKSLEKLEDPYFGNWWEAHKSFQKAQRALRELQKDFEQFFGPKVVERERDEQAEYILSWMWTLSTIIFFEFCTLMALCAINKCLGFDELVKELDAISPDDEEEQE